MTTIHGRNGMVYLQGSGAVAQPMLEATEWHITIDRDLGDDGSFGDTWVTQLSGRFKWSGTLNGNYDTASTLAFDSATQLTSRKLYLYPDASNTALYYYGNVFPKLSADMTLTAVAKMSGAIEGDGTLSLH